MNYLGVNFGRSLGFSTFGGVRVLCDPNCLAETTERTFPVSRHRSARVRKKLIKRFNGEFRKEPAIFKIGDAFVAHPALYAAVKARLNGA